jgi:hypothetical protein
MGIYRCNQCGFVSEDGVSAVGTKVPCAKCGAASTVYGTVFYVEKLVERYFAALRELAALKEAEVPAEPAGAPVAEPSERPLTGDAFNTDALATAAQHQPLQTWLATRQIQASFDFRAVDTTGFFDEAAKAIGDGYELFAELIERVRSAYRKSFSGLNLELGGLSQKDAQAVNGLCRKLHSYTFFSRYVYQKPEKIVRLNLQQAPAVRSFFEGGIPATLIPGDGIGPEIVDATLAALDALGAPFDWDRQIAGLEGVKDLARRPAAARPRWTASAARGWR